MKTRSWTTLTCVATVAATHIFYSPRFAYCAEPDAAVNVQVAAPGQIQPTELCGR